MRLSHWTTRAALLGLSVVAAAASAATPDPQYQALRQAPVAEAFVVENIVLRRDTGVVRLKSGTIGFTAPVDGRDTVAVFAGEGEFSLAPVTAIEKNYLKSLTEQETFAETFDRAVIFFTDGTGKEIRGQAKTKAAEAKLADILKDYRKRLRNESNDNIDAFVLADLYRAGQPGFFSAYLHGKKRSDLQFHVKPRGAEPVLGPEEVLLINVISGAPDELLYHAHLASEIKAGTATSDEDHRSVAAESYSVDTSIAKNDHVTGAATIRVRAVTAGDRVLPIALVSTLRVSKVTVDGQEIPFIQEDKKDDAALSIVLAKPLETGGAHEISFEYSGDKVIRKEGGGNFAVGARESWYPNVNTFHDHAKFDLTFRVPKQYTLVSVGKLEKQWTDKDLACSHWVSDIPLAVAGFNYGTFKKKSVTDSATGMTVEGFATTEAPDYLRMAESDATGTMAPSTLIDRTVVDAQNALRVYASWFGKSEFDRIAITQQPQFNFGQSWPSLVYLPMSAYLDATQRLRLLGNINGTLTDFVEEVTPHEVAHQYWGHMVGWSSYHDQWLSEGFATFSASLVLQFTRPNLGPFNHYWDEARKQILDKNKYGKRANDAGPVWLGARLMSEKNGGAVRGVMYEKGAYVLHMLRQMMRDQKEGDRPFMVMMHDFVQQHLNRNASTESFQRVVEKHMTPAMNIRGNGKMDWFFQEWVYGTAIPKYKLDYTLTEENGKTMLKGSVTQSEVTDDFIMLVPIYLDFDGQIARLGAAKLIGNSSIPVNVPLPKRPKRVLLNYMHDVLEQ
jgi:hypothetical protein